MSSARDHYDELLGSIYSWMLGDWETVLQEARDELRDLGIGGASSTGGVAIDLGAGTGAHSIPLAELDYSVVAVDTCAALLDQLKGRMAGHDIHPVLGDLLSFRSFHPGMADVILCMGDTLTHLREPEDVEELFHQIKAALAPGGLFVATFRDYSSTPLSGTSRFIPVRSDENRILTCFLEYRDDSVLVHDLLHSRSASGWETRVSAYPKLRLDPSALQAGLHRLGLAARLEPGRRGMVRLVATAPGTEQQPD
jgi:SAM-dependent methyltransferase